MYNTSSWLGLLLCLLVFTSCKDRHSTFTLEKVNAVYYWRTDLKLDSTERIFLQRHHINKMYCRYFDVVMSDDDATEPKPNATISFSDTLPDNIELIPTVYITEDCMHRPYQGLAEKIVKRIQQMNETNDIRHVSEIQIDCDYTSKSRNIYYQFLEEVKQAWGRTLSTTIRLHQLSMAIPPADYGVLMVYNTGDPRKWKERRSTDGRLLEEGKNPVLDYRDVFPYLTKLDDYPLPLATAYPVYQWIRNIEGVRVEHTVEAAEILKVKQALEKERKDLKNAIITYHLDKENINRYKPKTYEEIYHH